MILRRIGNKKMIADNIIKHFPYHQIYIEPFFGAGGMFFQKQKVKYNIVNDIDSDVFNLFKVLIDHKQKFIDDFMIMPVHEDLLNYWRKNKETEPVKKALRFLLMSNFTFLGKQDTLRSNPDNSKKLLLSKLDQTNKLLFDVQFFNKDFRKFLSQLSLYSEKRDLLKKTFIYADCPYLDTINTYSDNDLKINWSLTDCNDLFDSLEATECNFALSEFDHEFVLDQAYKRKLNVIHIGERMNLKNRRSEVLITNYKLNNTLFAF